MRLLTLILSLYSAAGWSQSLLTIGDYISQVRSRHGGIKAAEMTAAGARLYIAEARQRFQPNLNLGAEYRDDQKPNPQLLIFPTATPIPYNGVLTKSFTAGVSQETPYGVTGSFNYQTTSLKYPGLSPEFFLASPSFEIRTSLWRNFLGAESTAQADEIAFRTRAKVLAQDYLVQTSVLQAEQAYWQLALAREQLSISEAAVQRAQRLFKFSSRRQELALVDKSDSLQANANLRNREIDFRRAQDAHRSACLNFNLARGDASDIVPEKIETLQPQKLSQTEIPKKIASRLDTQSTEAQLATARSGSLATKQKYKPTFELYGSYAFNSQERNLSTAFSRSWDPNLPTRAIGLRLVMPLDFSTIRDIQNGYEQEARAQEILLERKRLEEEKAWKDLEVAFSANQERLTMLMELEKVQLEKLNFERDRHMRGRTTLYQVLVFENDYFIAQEQRVETLTNLLNIISQMKLYGGGPS